MSHTHSLYKVMTLVYKLQAVALFFLSLLVALETHPPSLTSLVTMFFSLTPPYPISIGKSIR